MGVKGLHCFPWYRRCKDKDRSKEPERPPQSEAPPEGKTRLCSTTSVSSEGEGAQGGQLFLTRKARVSFRHEMDSTMNAIDATY
ncbi:uncharacterized protein C17orf114-like [Lepisosteus oculatus]|uniref:uncharacterized protein C17orf114-like n=1 Tax=Lepisosteus oculatus TaxID=7918 RepID=UPI00372080F7